MVAGTRDIFLPNAGTGSGGGTSNLLFKRHRVPSPGQSDRVVNLTTHLHHILRLGMSAAVHPLPLFTFIAKAQVFYTSFTPTTTG